jgi:hypothetical protein
MEPIGRFLRSWRDGIVLVRRTENLMCRLSFTVTGAMM